MLNSSTNNNYNYNIEYKGSSTGNGVFTIECFIHDPVSSIYGNN